MEEETKVLQKPSLFGVIFNPTLQFSRMKERPVIWVPLIVLSVLSMLVAIMVSMTIDYSALTGMGLSPEQEEFTKTIGIVSGALGGLLGTPIMYLIYSAILFGIAKILKSPVTFKQMFSLMIFVSFISMIGQIINQLIIAAINGNPNIMLTSLNSFIEATGPLGGVLGMIEVFSIWYYILLVMGLVKVAQLSKAAAITITIIIFIITAIFAAITGAAQI